MPFRVPENTNPADRQKVYDLFGIGKSTDHPWIRRVKAFFTFGWNTAKLTDDYIKNTLLEASNRNLTTQALAANPKWLTRTKDLTVTTAVYAKLKSLRTEGGLISHLNEAVKTDRVFKMIHGKKELAAQALETFELKGAENKAKLQNILDHAVRKGNVDLIQALVKTHKDLKWKEALDRVVQSKVVTGKKMEMVDAILTYVDLKTVFADGKELVTWMQHKHVLIITAFIPHIGDLRDVFVNTLPGHEVGLYIRNSLPSFIFRPKINDALGTLKPDDQKQILKNILGIKYAIKHWDQLGEKEQQNYLGAKLFRETQHNGIEEFRSYFDGLWLEHEIAGMTERK